MRMLDFDSPEHLFDSMRPGDVYLLGSGDRSDEEDVSCELIRILDHAAAFKGKDSSVPYHVIAVWWGCADTQTDYMEDDYNPDKEEDDYFVPVYLWPHLLNGSSWMCAVDPKDYPLFAGYKIVVAHRYQQLIDEAAMALT